MDQVPGVVHVDGTGRLQSVKQEWNSRYYELIREFYELTGVPVVLNTSFNVMGKPIIHSVQDAVSVFMLSGLDAMFLEDMVVEKRPQPAVVNDTEEEAPETAASTGTLASS
jgi:carbamoyltransferase